MEDKRIQVTPEELYSLLGERLVIQYKLEQQIKDFYKQADEMAQEITRLRLENESLKNGKLEQSNNND